MEHKVITDQIKEEKIEKKIELVSYRSNTGKGKGRICQKEGENLKFECFPANPSQILPTFCHGTKVKPLKI